MGKSGERMGGYRGRRTLTDILKGIVVLLGVLVVLLLAGLLFGQRYIVYSDEGLRLELPFFRQEDPAPPSIGPGEINMIERPGSSEGEEEVVSPEEPAYVMSAVELEWEDLNEEAAAEKMEQAGANAVILTMKDEQGILHWESQSALAQALPVNGDPAANEWLKQWLQEDVYAIARVCCFRDNTVPYNRNNLALRATYGNWRDELGLRWMNPAEPDNWAYLAELCRELAELGFDEILLECYSFPELGMQESITTQAPEGKAKAAEEFLRQARRMANEGGAKLSVRVEPVVLSDEEALSGVTAALLNEQADCLWVDGDQADRAEQVLSDRAQERMVCVVPSLAESPIGHQAVLQKN